MRVGLFLGFAGRRCGGPEVYERELTRALAQVVPQHEYHLYCLNEGAESILDLKRDNVIYHRLTPRVRAVSMFTSLPGLIRRTEPHVFHAQIVTPPFCPPRTIMHYACSSLIVHPEFYPLPVRLRLRFLLHRAIPIVERVICPSEHVREVVLDTFKIPQERAPVVPIGVHPRFHPIPEPELRSVLRGHYKIDRPYFLFSGRWEARKNINRILEAFALFKRNTHTEHALVLTGGRSWHSKEALDMIRRLGIEESLIDVGRSPLDELPHLYAGADGLIYASLWEGFGMPIIEAMACGTPVVTSNNSAMPETAGPAALFVDPYSVEDIAGAMCRLSQDPQLVADLRQRGLERARHFTWEGVAQKTAALYEQVAG